MSPEQVRGREVDSRTDIYSLGIVLYEMLTGRVPFRTDSEYELMKSHLEQAPPAPRTFAPNIPAGVEHAVLRALAKNPDERFATAVEFRTALIATEIAKGGLSDTWFSAAVASGSVKQTRLVERSPGRPASESTDLQNPAALPTREAAPSARKSPPWLKHWAAVRLYVVGLALLGAGGVVAFLLIQQSPTPDTVSKERQSAEPASRPAAPVATPAPATQTAPPPALVDPAPVQPPYRQDAAAEDRERERRLMAAEKAAKRKAAEKALDLR
jgi:serine/threonine-protein kinase